PVSSDAVLSSATFVGALKGALTELRRACQMSVAPWPPARCEVNTMVSSSGLSRGKNSPLALFSSVSGLAAPNTPAGVDRSATHRSCEPPLLPWRLDRQ